ncbi:MAG: YciI family protein [Promethearchaeota archaeon]
MTVKKFYAIIYQQGSAWKPGVSVYEQDLRSHATYMEKLHKDKVLVLGGPFTDDSGGMAIINVESEEKAEEILKQDPAITNKVMNATIKPWHIAFEQ